MIFDSVVTEIRWTDIANIGQLGAVVGRRRRIRIQRLDVVVVYRQARGLSFAHHPFQRNVVEAKVAVAAADVRVHASKPNFVSTLEARWNEREAALIERKGVKAILDTLGRQR